MLFSGLIFVFLLPFYTGLDYFVGLFRELLYFVLYIFDNHSLFVGLLY